MSGDRDTGAASGDYRGAHSTYRTRMSNFRTELMSIIEEFQNYHKTLEEQGTVFETDLKQLNTYKGNIEKTFIKFQDAYFGTLATVAKAIEIGRAHV